MRPAAASEYERDGGLRAAVPVTNTFPARELLVMVEVTNAGHRLLQSLRDAWPTPWLPAAHHRLIQRGIVQMQSLPLVMGR